MPLGRLKAINIFIITIIFLICTNEKMKMDNLSWDRVARSDMVTNQIIARGVADKGVINAMRTVERHKFVRK